MMRAAPRWTMLLLLALVPLAAHGECRYESSGNTSVTFNLPSTKLIAANTPDGTVLATSSQAAPANPPVIECGYYNNGGQWKAGYGWMTYGVANSRGGYADDTTYETGIPGIGYRITHPINYLERYPLNNELLSSSTFSVTSGVELIKTGSIASGSTVVAGELGKWRWDDSSRNTLYPETFILGNSITFTTPSCTLVTNPIDVALPAVTTNVFGGVGSTSGKTPFQIQLNCPAGTAVTKITLHTATPDTTHPGVVLPAGAGYAAGIGVQVLDGNSNPVAFESQTVVTPPNATTSIPYFAQYFQTATIVTGGNVKATVTFDIFYQ